MEKHALILILSLPLLLECTNALQFILDDAEESDIEQINDPLQRLAMFIMTKLGYVSEFIISESLKLLKATSLELGKVSNPSEELLSYISELDEFINKHEVLSFRKSPRCLLIAFEAMQKLETIILAYADMVDCTPLKETIRKALKKSDIEAFQTALVEETDIYSEEFIEEFNLYLDTVSEAEKKENKIVLEWGYGFETGSFWDQNLEIVNYFSSDVKKN